MRVKAIILSVLMIFAGLIGSAQESVLLRTDRDLYITGEPVWITVDCLKSGTSEVSDLSKVAYVEVLNINNTPVSQLKLYLENGKASTLFNLPDTVSTGNYLIRTYTQWMRNYSPDLYFSKNIEVINPFSSDPFPKAETIFSSDTVIFYPEGGKVITGRINQFLIRSFQKSGMASAVLGNIISPSGEVLQEFTCDESGVAAFSFSPSDTGNYFCSIKTNEKPRKIHAFTVLEKATAIYLEDESNDQIRFGIITANSLSHNWRFDVVTASGALIKSYPVDANMKSEIVLRSSDLPDGYLCALLYDTNGEVQASRYFVRTATIQTAPVKVSLSKEAFLEREAAHLKLENIDDLSHVSVSVVKECLVNQESQIAFATSPLIISLEYFARLTNERLSFNQLLIPYQPVTEIRQSGSSFMIPEHKAEIVSGTIVDLTTQEAVRNEVFMLSFVGKYPTLDFSKTDSAGHFYFEAKRYGEQEIVIQPFENESLKANYKVNLDLKYCTRYSNRKAAPLFIDKKNMTRINRAIVNMQVNLLYKEANPFPAIQKPNPEPVSFYGIPGSSTTLDNFIELPSMEEIIREIVPKAHLVKKDDKFNISISEGDLPNSREINSFCMVDGVPVANQDNILKINFQRVEKIDVENRDVFVKSYKVGKIFNLITRDGEMGAFDFDKRLFRQSYQGFAPEFAFNSPNHSLPETKKSRLPDFRNVLYWNPELTFDTQNSCEIQFFTSDGSDDYKIVVEGINKAGMIERHEYKFRVTD